MWIEAAASYLVIGTFIVLVYPLRGFIVGEVRKTRRLDFLRRKPTPAWKFYALAWLSGLAFVLIWPVAIVSWWRHYR